MAEQGRPYILTKMTKAGREDFLAQVIIELLDKTIGRTNILISQNESLGRSYADIMQKQGQEIREVIKDLKKEIKAVRRERLQAMKKRRKQ